MDITSQHNSTSPTLATIPTQTVVDAYTFEQCKAMLLAPDLTAKQIGSLGERLCRAWLIEHHWHVLACNWHCRFGEIDIIALTSHSTIVFVEVKTRRSTSCGIPEEAVHAAKQMRVRRAAICWLGEHGSTIRHIGVRFDVIAVTVTPTDVFIHHVPEAF